MQDKLKVIQLVENKESDRNIALKFNVSKSQILRIRNNKENIKEIAANCTFQPQAKIMVNLSKFPEIDESSCQLIVQM